MRYLITGAKGLLGSTFLEALGPSAKSLTREDLSYAQSEYLERTIANHQPDVLVNCAAHVNAEQAEDDPASTMEANVEIPKRLSKACRTIGIPIVHFSSTGCYGAWKETPYLEEDPLKPTTVHHTSKVLGEEVIRTLNPEHLILRTGWLFGGKPVHKKNFVWQRLLEATKTTTLVSDQSQRGCPTWANDLVAQTCFLLDNNVRGTLNCVGAGTASRYEYVSKIVEIFEVQCSVIPGGSFARRAPVSPNETAINAQMQHLKLDQMPDWISSLNSYKKEILSWPEWHHLVNVEGAVK